MAPMTTNQFDVFASFASQEAFCAFHSNYSSDGVVRLMFTVLSKKKRKKRREKHNTHNESLMYTPTKLVEGRVWQTRGNKICIRIQTIHMILMRSKRIRKAQRAPASVRMRTKVLKNDTRN